MAYTPGKGTTLKVNDTTIAQVVSISGPGMATRTTETTHLASEKATHMATISEAGELSATIEYDPADSSHSTLFGLWKNPAEANWTLVFADSGATVYSFAGILTGFEPSGMEVDEKVTADITILISGDISSS